MKIQQSILFLAFGLFVCGVTAACGSDDSGDVDAPAAQADASSGDVDAPADHIDAGGGDEACTVTATATPDTQAKTITGVGLVECSAAGSIEVETCVQWNPSGTFEDIMCLSSSQSGVAQLEVENVSSCGLTSGRSFRARVNATVDGNALPEALSDEVGCE
ncbi:MAG TPA: hypothetical protein VFG83_11220 [Kofleriaceae bacterium]|nr:hypothetical protein [Kofleriaceae bacterium]